jgi:hypothetical protein
VENWVGKWCVEPARGKESELKLWEEEWNKRKSRWKESLLFYICSFPPLLLSSYTCLCTSLTSLSLGLLLTTTSPAVSLYNEASSSSNLFFHSITDGHMKLQMFVTSY